MARLSLFDRRVSSAGCLKEAIVMVRKEECPQCKGDKLIAIVLTSGKDAWVKCPSCGGNGYKVRLMH